MRIDAAMNRAINSPYLALHTVVCPLCLFLDKRGSFLESDCLGYDCPFTISMVPYSTLHITCRV